MNTLRNEVLSKFTVGDLDNPVTAKTITRKLNQADDLYRLDVLDSRMRAVAENASVKKFADVPKLMSIFYGELTNGCRKCGEPIRKGYSLCLNCSI